MSDLRALLSVHDKSGLVDLARGLVDLGWELLSTGGTAAVLLDAGLPVTEVADVTGAPEILEGRVKTLHPAIHGGILADRSDPAHLADLEARGIAPIDLVVANLYPFADWPGVEMIDIGGSAMVRAAAKNHAHVGVVVDPGDYPGLLDELRSGNPLSEITRLALARRAFAHTSSYDASIVAWLDAGLPVTGADNGSTTPGRPDTLHLGLERVDELRYGENPHQTGARYRWAVDPTGWWDAARLHGGKAMSYLNVLDTEAAWRLVHELGDEPAAVVVKHTNPCGAAVAGDIGEAWTVAHACDPTSAFGGIVAVNRPLTMAVAGPLAEVFTEVVVAPSYESDALDTLRARPNLRILEAPPPGPRLLDVRAIDGGLLVQGPDPVDDDVDDWTVVTRREPSETEWLDLAFAWRVVARVTSNAIVLARHRQTVGIGAGQQNRRDAVRLAVEKADGRATGGVCASDAFFPFRDGLDTAIGVGVTAVVQPGGSVRDDEVVAAADEAGLAMVFTGRRHFRH